MKLNVEDIVSEVLARLDEPPGDRGGEGMGNAGAEEPDGQYYVEYGEPWYDIGSLVRSLLVSEATKVVALADQVEFTEWLPLSGEVATIWLNGGNYKRVFPLPVDYMRFLYLRMSDWPEAVFRLADLSGEIRGLRRYWICRDRGERKSPMVAVGFHDGKRVLEIFGSVAGSRVAEGGYIPLPVIDGEGNLVFPSSLRGALIDRLVETIRGIRR